MPQRFGAHTTLHSFPTRRSSDFNKRSTTTAVACTTPRALNQASICTATVSDADAGTASFPQGTVTFTLDASSTAGAAGNIGSAHGCTPVTAPARTPTCSGTYTPP